MAGLTDLTSYDDVRAALGVTIDELSDSTIALPLYENSLAGDLDSISEDLADRFMAAKAASPQTKAEQKLVRCTQVFATYSVARELLSGLPMFAFKEVSDGKAADTRFAQDPYKATSAAVETKYESARAALEAAWASLNSTTAATTLRVFMAVAPRSTDPVTGS